MSIKLLCQWRLKQTLGVFSQKPSREILPHEGESGELPDLATLWESVMLCTAGSCSFQWPITWDDVLQTYLFGNQTIMTTDPWWPSQVPAGCTWHCSTPSGQKPSMVGWQAFLKKDSQFSSNSYRKSLFTVYNWVSRSSAVSLESCHH